MGTVPSPQPTSPTPRTRRWRQVLALGMLVALTAAATPARAEDEAAGDDARVPPRLGYVHGEVSFWRPGADAWAPAQVNTPLAPGDTLHVAQEGGLEIQIGPRAFVRAAAGTTLAFDGQEPDLLQLRLTGGHVSLDLGEGEPGRAVELAMPAAVATIEHPGYYRAVVTDEATTVIARRGGQATVTTGSGETAVVASDTQLVVSGDDAPSLATAAAPDMDTWDHWNLERTASLLATQSAQYVPPGVYGVEDLDRHGTWRVEPEYGPVWVPMGVAAGWAPYSTGSWIWDRYYGWTWVDAAPWGWAPYHYGRWVHVRGHWAWAPGPVVVRPVYAPALVAFFGVGARGPLGWCALGWGEPLLPWWGRPGFVGAPWWGGWGGPRVVNRVVVHKSVVVRAEHVTVFQNVRVRHAVVVVDRDRFGRGPVRRAFVRDRDLRDLRPVRGDLSVKPRPASLVATPGPARRPPDRVLERSVVTTRRPPAGPGRAQAPGLSGERRSRVVPAPPRARRLEDPARPRPEPRGSTEPRERIERQVPGPAPTRPVLPRDATTPPRRTPETAPERSARPPDARPRAPLPTPDGDQDRGQRGAGRSRVEQAPARRPDPPEALPQIRGGRPVPPPQRPGGVAPAPQPPTSVAPTPPARRLETPGRPRGEVGRQAPGRSEPIVAPGGRRTDAPAMRPPARVQPPRQGVAPGGAGDRGRDAVRSRPEGRVRQPSPAVRQQRPAGARQPGPAPRAPRQGGGPPAGRR